jgi:hypothetical protein
LPDATDVGYGALPVFILLLNYLILFSQAGGSKPELSTFWTLVPDLPSPPRVGPRITQECIWYRQAMMRFTWIAQTVYSPAGGDGKTKSVRSAATCILGLCKVRA